MKISEAARKVDVDAHVLRHWHEMRVVVPERTNAGHRDYSKDDIRRLRVVKACQNVGMSLAEIQLILHRDEAGRTEVIERRLRWIRAQRDQLTTAERFLEHVVDCTHDVLTRCPDCTAYSSSVGGS